MTCLAKRKIKTLVEWGLLFSTQIAKTLPTRLLHILLNQSIELRNYKDMWSSIVINAQKLTFLKEK